MYKLSTPCFVVTAVWLLATLGAYGQATMPNAPRGAYSNYFKYYWPGAADMPAGADHASDAVIGIYISDIQDDPDAILEGSATGFPVYSKRDDRRICVCTAGHNIKHFNANPGDVISFDAYMKYQGKPSNQNSRFNQPVSGFKSTLHAEIMAVIYNDSDPAIDSADAALLLVDPAELPVAAPYLLGYSEQEVYNPQSSFYTTGFPHGMSQRIANNLPFAAAPLGGVPSSALFRFSGTGNHAIGPGSSGSPVFYKGQVNFVTGILAGPGSVHNVASFIPYAETIFGDRPIQFSRDMRATKMKVLMPDIRKHCWNKQDSAMISNRQSYKQGVVLDNNTQVLKFSPDHAIASQAGIAAIADPGYGILSPGSILLKANRLTINCPLTPGADLRHFFTLAQEIRVDAGFSYTASGSYYLNMNTVVPELTAGTARTAPAGNTGTADSMDASGFSVYPNPGSSGLFYVSFPANEGDYSIKVFSADGRLVHQVETVARQKPYPLSLSGRAPGLYVLNLYKKQTGEKLFSKTIIYQ